MMEPISYILYAVLFSSLCMFPLGLMLGSPCCLCDQDNCAPLDPRCISLRVTGASGGDKRASSSTQWVDFRLDSLLAGTGGSYANSSGFAGAGVFVIPEKLEFRVGLNSSQRQGLSRGESISRSLTGVVLRAYKLPSINSGGTYCETPLVYQNANTISDGLPVTVVLHGWDFPLDSDLQQRFAIYNYTSSPVETNMSDAKRVSSYSRNAPLSASVIGISVYGHDRLKISEQQVRESASIVVKGNQDYGYSISLPDDIFLHSPVGQSVFAIRLRLCNGTACHDDERVLIHAYHPVGSAPPSDEPLSLFESGDHFFDVPPLSVEPPPRSHRDAATGVYHFWPQSKGVYDLPFDYSVKSDESGLQAVLQWEASQSQASQELLPGPFQPPSPSFSAVDLKITSWSYGHSMGISLGVNDFFPCYTANATEYVHDSKTLSYTKISDGSLHEITILPPHQLCGLPASSLPLALLPSGLTVSTEDGNPFLIDSCGLCPSSLGLSVVSYPACFGAAGDVGLFVSESIILPVDALSYLQGFFSTSRRSMWQQFPFSWSTLRPVLITLGGEHTGILDSAYYHLPNPWGKNAFAKPLDNQFSPGKLTLKIEAEDAEIVFQKETSHYNTKYEVRPRSCVGGSTAQSLVGIYVPPKDGFEFSGYNPINDLASTEGASEINVEAFCEGQSQGTASYASLDYGLVVRTSDPCAPSETRATVQYGPQFYYYGQGPTVSVDNPGDGEYAVYTQSFPVFLESGGSCDGVVDETLSPPSWWRPQFNVADSFSLTYPNPDPPSSFPFESTSCRMVGLWVYVRRNENSLPMETFSWIDCFGINRTASMRKHDIVASEGYYVVRLKSKSTGECKDFSGGGSCFSFPSLPYPFQSECADVVIPECGIAASHTGVHGNRIPGTCRLWPAPANEYPGLWANDYHGDDHLAVRESPDHFSLEGNYVIGLGVRSFPRDIEPSTFVPRIRIDGCLSTPSPQEGDSLDFGVVGYYAIGQQVALYFLEHRLGGWSYNGEEAFYFPVYSPAGGFLFPPDHLLTYHSSVTCDGTGKFSARVSLDYAEGDVTIYAVPTDPATGAPARFIRPLAPAFNGDDWITVAGAASIVKNIPAPVGLIPVDEPGIVSLPDGYAAISLNALLDKILISGVVKGSSVDTFVKIVDEWGSGEIHWPFGAVQAGSPVGGNLVVPDFRRSGLDGARFKGEIKNASTLRLSLVVFDALSNESPVGQLTIDARILGIPAFGQVAVNGVAVNGAAASTAFPDEVLLNDVSSVIITGICSEPGALIFLSDQPRDSPSQESTTADGSITVSEILGTGEFTISSSKLSDAAIGEQRGVYLTAVSAAHSSQHYSGIARWYLLVRHELPFIAEHEIAGGLINVMVDRVQENALVLANISLNGEAISTAAVHPTAENKALFSAPVPVTQAGDSLLVRLSVIAPSGASVWEDTVDVLH